MTKQLYIRSVALITTMLSFPVASFATAAIPGRTIPLPSCGADPTANTKMLQAQLDLANPGDTLVLPAGVCVVAKCDIAQGRLCYGAAGRHFSALHIGNKSQLTLEGAADGTSVLKLDPNPPGTPGRHAYCGDTHVLSIQLSRSITLRAFTIDGSDGELPEDATQCGTQRISEHMHDVRVLNAENIVLDQMEITKAHGDGLNLMAENTQTAIPFTERVTVTNTDFLANDRAGITFQRNVGFVSIVGNYFRNSGGDQDLDMEPTGSTSLGPYEIDIDHNVFERLHPKITVALGAASTKPARGIRFTHNTIRASPQAVPYTGQGGCIFVYAAAEVTIAHNTVIGAQGCVTVEAQKVTNLRVEDNHFEGFTNVQRAGKFVPKPVIEVSPRVVGRGDPDVCGAPPKPSCPYFIHYPDRIVVSRNTIVQHVQRSPGVWLGNADESMVTDNIIEATNTIAPVGAVDPRVRAIGVALPFGVPKLPSYGHYENERTQFKGWAITGNQLKQFADGLKIWPVKAGVGVVSTTLAGNTFNTKLSAPRGIYLEGAANAPQAGFITSLLVTKNSFGCGFSVGPIPPIAFPLHAFVRPSGQAHTGNVGVLVPCQ